MNKLKSLLTSRTGAYLLLTLAFFLSEEWLVSQMGWWGNRMGLPLVRHLADAALLALPVMWFRKRWITFPWVVVVNVYLLANIWYYRNYGNFIPLSSLFLFGNLKGLGGNILASMVWGDLLIVFPSLLWMVTYAILPLRRDRLDPPICLCAIACILGVTTLGYLPKNSELKGACPVYHSYFDKGFTKYGLINYWIVQIQYLRGCSATDVAEAEDFMAHNTVLHTHTTDSCQGRNLIIIVVESLSNWEIGLSVEEEEVTPTLNRLVLDRSAIYIPHCLSQVKDGRSSDCHLMFNTGLLPQAAGAAANTTSTHSFYTLSQALSSDNYHSYYLVADDKTLTWHQAQNYENYGYTHVYDMLGDGWDCPDMRQDERLFARSLPILRSLPQSFLANVVTLSMHNVDPLPGYTPLSQANINNSDHKNHLIRTHYTDHHLGLFLDSLKACGLYNQSIIVIMGDHYAIPFNQWEGRDRTELSDLFVPLIILNSPIRPERTDMVIGQIDIYPSLLDLMGVGDYVWRGLGESIFTPGGHSGCAVYHTGEAIGNTDNDSIVAHKRNLWRISDIILRSDYFRKHPLDI